MTANFNGVLAAELSAYRFVAGKIAPVSSEQEKAAIERESRRRTHTRLHPHT